MSRLEAQMIMPIRTLMTAEMGLDFAAQEVTAGYGIADLVGTAFDEENCLQRERMSLSIALDHYYLIAVLTTLHRSKRTSLQYVLERVDISESTLRKLILPKLTHLGLIERYRDGYIRLFADIPSPVQRIVSVEAKQTRWREAIIQARRYTFFSDQTYIAIWSDALHRVDRALLYRHRLGLISVTPEIAEIVIEAPSRRPRRCEMHRYCAEMLYGKMLAQTALSPIL